MHTQWVVIVNGQDYGPYTLDQLRDFVSAGRVSAETVIRPAQGGSPFPASRLSSLFPPADFASQHNVQHYQDGTVEPAIVIDTNSPSMQRRSSNSRGSKASGRKRKNKNQWMWQLGGAVVLLFIVGRAIVVSIDWSGPVKREIVAGLEKAATREAAALSVINALNERLFGGEGEQSDQLFVRESPKLIKAYEELSAAYKKYRSEMTKGSRLLQGDKKQQCLALGRTIEPIDADCKNLIQSLGAAANAIKAGKEQLAIRSLRNYATQCQEFQQHMANAQAQTVELISELGTE